MLCETTQPAFHLKHLPMIALIQVALQGRSMTTPEDVQLAAERFSNVHTEALLTELLLPDSLSDAPDHDVEQGRRPFTSSSPYSVR